MNQYVFLTAAIVGSLHLINNQRVWTVNLARTGPTRIIIWGHLRSWSRIFEFRLERTETDFSIWLATENSGSLAQWKVDPRGLKAMLHGAIFLATCNATMTNKKISSCRGGVTRLQLFSQLATRTITNKMAEISRERMSSDWPILKKVALQVAEGMLHACNLSRNVAESRGSFYFSCNSQRNNCSCKMGCYTWIFSCNLQRNVRCVASCKKNCFV